METSKKYICIDGVLSMGVHNGITRISTFVLNTSGKPEESATLIMPERAIAALIEALQKSRK